MGALRLLFHWELAQYVLMNDSSVRSLERRPASDLYSRSFVGLLATQFLGVMNDNLFRWFVVPIGMLVVGDQESLSLGIACFTLPYLVFAPFAGYLADRFSKRQVIVGCKIAEIALMALAIVGLLCQSIEFLFFAVALMGTQSALFSPSKFGAIPELVQTEAISTANGLMGLVTVVASAIGTFFGFWIYGITRPDLRQSISLIDVWPAAAALLGIAAVGWMTSLLIEPLAAADPDRRLPRNPVSEAWSNLRLLSRSIPLLRTALGIAFFWFLASLANVTINIFGLEELNLTETSIGGLIVVLVIGVGLGSVLAGVWSGGHIELGLVPLGATGISIASILLYATGQTVDPAVPASMQQAFWLSCACLFALGMAAGLFNIPLEAFLQHHSPVQQRGIILAASNFVTFSLILASAGVFYVLQKVLGLSASEIFLVTGLGTIPVIIYAFRLLPDATIRFLVWLGSHTIYRVRVLGRANIPEKGGALIVPNHVTWLDGVFLLLASSRPIRMVAYADYVTHGAVGWLCRTFGVIPIKQEEGPKSIIRTLKTARAAALNGELVCIFAEGQLTRTGQLQTFQRGLMRIVDGTDIPVIPTYLDGLWGSIFSFHGGKYFWKWPTRWPYPLSIHFGKPMTNPKSVHEVREAVEDLGVEAVTARKQQTLVPQRQFLRNCRRTLFRSKVADSTGVQMTGGKLLAGTLVMKRLLTNHVVAPDEKMVGVLLPPSVGAVLVNAALSLMRRVGVNLNYTLSNDDVNYCVREAGLKHVLTSRKFLSKRPIGLDAGVDVVFLEDLRDRISGWQKLLCAAAAYLLPAGFLEWLFGLKQIQPDDLLTVIFTSGSTGEPKGVMLSHHNVGSNIEAVGQVLHIAETDVLIGVLPFFHSFGYTVALWLTLCLKPKTVYHFNPLDGREIGKLCEQHGVTIMVATPTFLRSYLKRCDKTQLRTVDLAVVGAEKMPLDLAKAFEDKFGVAPSEGYGTTELSPAVALNIPDSRSGGAVQPGTRLGTVGRPLPGVRAKVVHADTGEDLQIGEEGLLMIKGPNVMLGYMNKPDQTSEVIRDGWYDTGDMARIDDDGFIEITGRQSRFSKIGGEMVPHLKIESELNRIVDDGTDEEGAVQLAITSVPDEKKGERLVVLHKPLSKPITQILQELAEAGIPNLWIPAADSFVEVDEVPLLGSGKLDLRAVKQTALDARLP